VNNLLSKEINEKRQSARAEEGGGRRCNECDNEPKIIGYSTATRTPFRVSLTSSVV